MNILLLGYLTFFSKTCDFNGLCELPKPTAPSIQVSGSLDVATQPGTASQFKTSFSGSDLKGTFGVYYMNPKDGSKPYVITQIDLFNAKTSAPVGQCSSYHSVEDASPFPVGACSIFNNIENEKLTQLGVSFSRIALSK